MFILLSAGHRCNTQIEPKKILKQHSMNASNDNTVHSIDSPSISDFHLHSSFCVVFSLFSISKQHIFARCIDHSEFTEYDGDNLWFDYSFTQYLSFMICFSFSMRWISFCVFICVSQYTVISIFDLKLYCRWKYVHWTALIWMVSGCYREWKIQRTDEIRE